MIPVVRRGGTGKKRVAAGGAANVILNGTFADTSVWTGAGFNGKTISGGKANFVATTAFDGFNQGSLTLVSGKYYELTWTVSGRSSGTVYPFLSGGTGPSGTPQSANGTYIERLLVASGNNSFGFQLNTGPGTLSVDDITLVGPYNTATVGGS